jgi:hypothetical protein
MPSPCGDVAFHFYRLTAMKLHVPMILFAAALASLTGVAFAADVAPATPTVESSVQTPAEILQIQRALRERLEKPSGEYSRFDDAAIHKMERAQDRVFSMLKGIDSIDQLTPYQKTDLSNALDEIKATLLANESSRQICHRERKTGTNLVALRCETMAEREARARDSNQQMSDFARTVQTRSGN